MTSPTALVTVDDVRTHLNMTTFENDAELQTFIDAATPLIDNIAGPTINTSITEYHSGGFSTIVLNRLPIVSVTSVVETKGQTNYTLTEGTLGSITNGFAFTIDYTTGTIIRRAYNAESIFADGNRNITVTYVAGRSSVPGNIRLATLMLVQHLWMTSQANSNGQRATIGGDDSFTPGMGFAVPNRVKELLQPSPRVPGVA